MDSQAILRPRCTRPKPREARGTGRCWKENSVICLSQYASEPRPKNVAGLGTHPKPQGRKSRPLSEEPEKPALAYPAVPYSPSLCLPRAGAIGSLDTRRVSAVLRCTAQPEPRLGKPLAPPQPDRCPSGCPLRPRRTPEGRHCPPVAQGRGSLPFCAHNACRKKNTEDPRSALRTVCYCGSKGGGQRGRVLRDRHGAPRARPRRPI